VSSHSSTVFGNCCFMRVLTLWCVMFFRYQNVREIWFDGAKGAQAKNMSYYFSDWFSMVKELQSSINIFSDAGPDVRWVGQETGSAGYTCWSTINRTSLSIGNSSITQ